MRVTPPDSAPYPCRRLASSSVNLYIGLTQMGSVVLVSGNE